MVFDLRPLMMAFLRILFSPWHVSDTEPVSQPEIRMRENASSLAPKVHHEPSISEYFPPNGTHLWSFGMNRLRYINFSAYFRILDLFRKCLLEPIDYSTEICIWLLPLLLLLFLLLLFYFFFIIIDMSVSMFAIVSHLDFTAIRGSEIANDEPFSHDWNPGCRHVVLLLSKKKSW